MCIFFGSQNLLQSANEVKNRRPATFPFDFPAPLLIFLNMSLKQLKNLYLQGMRFEFQRISIFLSILFFPLLGAAQSVNQPLDHWGYHFLARLEARGLFSSYELRARPVPRDRLADIIHKVYQTALQKPDVLSKTEWRLLEQLMSDFSAELSGREDISKKLRNEPHLFAVKDKIGTILGDLVGEQAIISNRGGQYDPDQLLSETMIGGRLRGNLGGVLGFFADAQNRMTRGEKEIEEQFDPSQGSPVVTSGTNVFRDRATAYFVWETPWIRVQAGRDEFDWGPAFRGGVTLSNNAPPADLIRLSLRFQRFKYSFMHAWLRSGLGAKYLAAHRLDFRVLAGLYLGASETVVYGDRHIEPAYLNPLMLYHIAEHHLGDKDNNNLAFDLTLTRIPNVTLYGEWFIDDMTSMKSWSGYFGNKFAWVFGGLWVDPLKLKNVDLRAEYTRISPYVYSHWDSLNIYTHYDKIIGHPLGPNADRILVELGWQASRDFRIQVSVEQQRHGVGGADTITRPAVGERKDFLQGVIEKNSAFAFRLIDQVRRDLFISLSYTFRTTENPNLVAGASSDDHLARIQLTLNY